MSHLSRLSLNITHTIILLLNVLRLYALAHASRGLRGCAGLPLARGAKTEHFGRSLSADAAGFQARRIGIQPL